MKIRISVYATIEQLYKSWLYRRDVEWNESIAFPYDNVCKTLQLLYPNACCVTFDVFNFK